MTHLLNDDQINHLCQKLLNWSDQFETFTLLDSCPYYANEDYLQLGKYDYLAAAGCKEVFTPAHAHTFWKELQLFIKQKWVFGYFGYDLKNTINNLSSLNYDYLKLPEYFLYVPEIVIGINGHKVSILHNRSGYTSGELINSIFTAQTHAQPSPVSFNYTPVVSYAEYSETIKQIHSHLQAGDIYEMNYCIPFRGVFSDIHFPTLYLKLREATRAPMSAFMKHHGFRILSASPERFLQKSGNRVMAQPMKGTAARSSDPTQDRINKSELSLSAKERSENVMIVDLMRNDLGKLAVPGEVTVRELFGVYSFRYVHQMVSTIEAIMSRDVVSSDIILSCFPMGSMTGAPKLSAMQLAEKFEIMKRGVYSGCLGYFNPDGDFDFNVIIRTVVFNLWEKTFEFCTGSAITLQSEAEKEYTECLLKADTFSTIFGTTSGS